MDKAEFLSGQLAAAMADVLAIDGTCKHCGQTHDWPTTQEKLFTLRSRVARQDHYCVGELRVALALSRAGQTAALSAAQAKKPKTSKQAQVELATKILGDLA